MRQTMRSRVARLPSHLKVNTITVVGVVESLVPGVKD